MTVKEVLTKARELITSPEAWTQGAYARDAQGLTLPRIDYDKATCFCAVGAIRRAARLTEPTAASGFWGREGNALFALANATYLVGRDPASSVMRFNDSHQHAEVLAAFDKAIGATNA